MKFYTYVYFNEGFTPYWVGEGSRERFLVSHPERDHGGVGIPVPPKDRILRFYFNTKKGAQDFEKYLVTRIGRRDIVNACGHHGPLLNKTDGGAGCSNNPLQRKKASENCRIVGRHNVQTGQVSDAGLAAAASGALAKARASRTLESFVKAGKTISDRHSKSFSDRLKRFHKLHSDLYRDLGKKNAKYLTHDSGHQSKAATAARHIQWHVNRGLVNPRCSLCEATSHAR